MEERKRLIAEIHAFLVKAAIMAVTLWVIFGVVFGVMQVFRLQSKIISAQKAERQLVHPKFLEILFRLMMQKP